MIPMCYFSKIHKGEEFRQPWKVILSDVGCVTVSVTVWGEQKAQFETVGRCTL